MPRTLSLALYLLAILVCPIATPTQAGLIISIQNAQFTEGSNGSIDVLISSSTPIELTSYSFEFLIEQVGATTSELRFADPQSDSQLLSSNYVFAAGSYKRDGDPSNGIPPDAIGSVGTKNFINDSFIGLDFATSTAYPMIGSQPSLLATLDFVSGPGVLGTKAGDEFRIRLVSGPFTDFTDENFSSIDYSSTDGKVQIISAVPEPSSLSIFLLAAVPLCRKLFRSSFRISRKN